MSMYNKFQFSILILVFIVIPYGELFSHSRHPFRFSQSPYESSEESFSLSSETESAASIVIVAKDEDENLTEKSNKLTHEDDELRSILCPGISTFQRYDLRAGKCAEIDTQSHCGSNMIFKEELESSAYGYCECDFENHDKPLVFKEDKDKKYSACYPIYEQAYCKSGEWLVLSKSAKGPVCERNQCQVEAATGFKEMRGGRRSKLIFPLLWGNEAEPNNANDEKILKFRDEKINVEGSRALKLVPLNGTGPCVPLGETSRFCQLGEKVIIASDDIFPRCANAEKFLRKLSIIPNACPPGSYYSIIGYCQPVWDF